MSGTEAPFLRQCWNSAGANERPMAGVGAAARMQEQERGNCNCLQTLRGQLRASGQVYASINGAVDHCSKGAHADNTVRWRTPT